MDGISENISA